MFGKQKIFQYLFIQFDYCMYLFVAQVVSTARGLANPRCCRLCLRVLSRLRSNSLRRGATKRARSCVKFIIHLFRMNIVIIFGEFTPVGINCIYYLCINICIYDSQNLVYVHKRTIWSLANTYITVCPIEVT